LGWLWLCVLTVSTQPLVNSNVLRSPVAWKTHSAARARVVSTSSPSRTATSSLR